MINSGKVDVIWDDSYKHFAYEKQPLMDYEIERWRSEGYYNESFSGHMYGSKNPMPEWVHEVASKIGLHKCGFVFYKMKTLDIMPNHVDHFQTYMRVFDAERKDVYRALVFLEDWKPGHYLEVDHKGVVNWNAGDYFLWSADVEHAASNIGIEDRYTLQITGTM